MKVLTRTYAFDDEEARARLKALGDYWWKKHGIVCEWRGHSVRLVGKKLGVKYDATVTIDEGEVRAEVQVGWLADKLGGPDYVARKVDEYLDPARTLDVLRARIPT